MKLVCIIYCYVIGGVPEEYPGNIVLAYAWGVLLIPFGLQPLILVEYPGHGSLHRAQRVSPSLADCVQQRVHP
jgi:hypothetical protein